MAGDLLRFYRDFMADAPDEVGGGMAFITAPPEEFVPEPVRGQPVVGVVVLLRRRRSRRARRRCGRCGSSARPALDMVQPMPYVAVQQLLDARATRRACRTTGRADFLAELPDEAIDTFVGHATQAGLAAHPDPR